MKIIQLLNNKIFKETFWSFMTKGTTFLIFIFLNIYLARKLGVESFGEWSFLFSVLTISFTLGYFGVNASSRVFLAKYNKTKKLKSVFKSSFILRLKISIIFIILLSLFVYPISILLKNTSLNYLIFLSLPLIFLKVLIEFYKEVFQGVYKLKYQFYINILEYGLYLTFVLILLNYLISLENIIISYTISLFISSLFGSMIFYNLYKKEKKSKSVNFQKQIMKYSIPLIILSLGLIIYTEIDTIMIGILVGKGEVGIYSVAKNLINKLPQIALAIAMGVGPLFAKITLSNKKQIKKFFFRLIVVNSFIYIPLVIVLIISAKFIILLFFGEQYSKSILPLQILSLWVLMVSYNMFIAFFMDYQIKAWKRSINFLISILLNVLLNFILIPKYGSVGAAIATTISYIPYFLINYFEIRKIIK